MLKVLAPSDAELALMKSGAVLVGRPNGIMLVAGATLFFEDRIFNPFMATGGLGSVIDDFHANWNFDRGPLGFVGGGRLTLRFGGTSEARAP